MTHFYKTLKGELANVQRALAVIVEKIQEYSQRNHTQDHVKLLIQQEHVAKIIGVGNIG